MKGLAEGEGRLLAEPPVLSGELTAEPGLAVKS